MPWTDPARRQYARPAACAAAQEHVRLQIVMREPGTRGFALLPRRPPRPFGLGPFGNGAAKGGWVVERTFAWFGRNRRLAKDFEATIGSAVTMVISPRSSFWCGGHAEKALTKSCPQEPCPNLKSGAAAISVLGAPQGAFPHPWQ